MQPPPSMDPRIRHKLLRRQSILRGQLGAVAFDGSDLPSEVHDCKDLAAEEARIAVAEVALAHAAQELARIAAALQRMDDGTYGICQDCGEPIDERRLLALPPTDVCADCQRVREAATAAAK